MQHYDLFIRGIRNIGRLLGAVPVRGGSQFGAGWLPALSQIPTGAVTGTPHVTSAKRVLASVCRVLDRAAPVAVDRKDQLQHEQEKNMSTAIPPRHYRGRARD